MRRTAIHPRTRLFAGSLLLAAAVSAFRSPSPPLRPDPPRLSEAAEEAVAPQADGSSSRRAFLATACLAATVPAATAASAPASDLQPRPVSPALATGAEQSAPATGASVAVAEASASASAWGPVFSRAWKKAVGGGSAGASAAVVQVLSLMWLRTAMNYQYRYGGSLPDALQELYRQGGIPRFYQGLPFALVQGPLTRFGDTAANVGVLAALEGLDGVPLPAKTACASVAAALWRVALLPVDASKTALQVEGPDGLSRLWERALGEPGIGTLYRGAIAQVAATAVGHFPWFVTYNYLDTHLPLTLGDGDSVAVYGLLRSAGMGLAASCASDVASNSLRVIKTTTQTISLSANATSSSSSAGDDTNKNNNSDSVASYRAVVAEIVERDGIAGLFGRGLRTRLLTNAIQGALFSVLWRYFQQQQQQQR